MDPEVNQLLAEYLAQCLQAQSYRIVRSEYHSRSKQRSCLTEFGRIPFQLLRESRWSRRANRCVASCCREFEIRPGTPLHAALYRAVARVRSHVVFEDWATLLHKDVVRALTIEVTLWTIGAPPPASPRLHQDALATLSAMEHEIERLGSARGWRQPTTSYDELHHLLEKWRAGVDLR